MAKIAFVTGANGITGGGITEHLSTKTTAEEWSQIVITSRSPLAHGFSDSRIRFVALDFLEPVEELVLLMRGVCGSVTHAYFSSYVHRDEFTALQSANRYLFENFLSALVQVSPKLQNVTLQTGAKYYNGHLHPVAWPIPEDTPRTAPAEDNVYYPQGDFLASKQAGESWTYNVIRPGGMVGATHKPNGMNMVLPLTVYILVGKEQSVEAKMPTNARMWNSPEEYSHNLLVADLTVFVSTHGHCAIRRLT